MENDDEDLTSNKKASANTSGTDDGQNLAEFDIEVIIFFQKPNLTIHGEAII